MIKIKDFDQWWKDVGQKMSKLTDHSNDEHMRRVAMHAYWKGNRDARYASMGASCNQMNATRRKASLGI